MYSDTGSLQMSDCSNGTTEGTGNPGESFMSLGLGPLQTDLSRSQTRYSQLVSQTLADKGSVCNKVDSHAQSTGMFNQIWQILSDRCLTTSETHRRDPSLIEEPVEDLFDLRGAHLGAIFRLLSGAVTPRIAERTP